jgi:excisionase family DNA binding protein
LAGVKKEKNISVVKDVYTPAEAAQRLGLSLNGVYEFLRQGIIPALKINRKYLIPVSTFNRWLETAGNKEEE